MRSNPLMEENRRKNCSENGGDIQQYCTDRYANPHHSPAVENIINTMADQPQHCAEEKNSFTNTKNRNSRTDQCDNQQDYKSESHAQKANSYSRGTGIGYQPDKQSNASPQTSSNENQN